ncbi:MAG: DUF1800 family protein [Flavobacteriaceae bacterium]|nr:DUF1800 family protein [Flavobacteriaceae bacterium]
MASLDSFSGVLGSRLAKHLLRRTSFNYTKARIEEFAGYNVNEALDVLLAPSQKNLNQPIHYPGSCTVNISGENVQINLTHPAPWINDEPAEPNGFGVVKENCSGKQKENDFLAAWWMDEARRDTSLRSKMTYFLFTNFTAPQKDNGDSSFYYDYLMLLEHFCLTDWKELVFQVTVNPKMLDFLNGNVNVFGGSNENYARELLELYTIGVEKPVELDQSGNIIPNADLLNYNYQDISEAARVLTGWSFDKNDRRELPKNGVENGDLPTANQYPENHDFGQKQFSSYLGNLIIPAYDPEEETQSERMESEIRMLIDAILAQEETAKYICRKLYRFFVSRSIPNTEDNLEIERDIISPLAQIFRDSDYNLTTVISKLLKSQHFFDADDNESTNKVIGGLIKSPLELVLQTLAVTNFSVPDPISDDQGNYTGEDHYKVFYLNYITNKVLIPSAQPIFGNTNTPPAGFPAHYSGPTFDKSWFNASTIIARYDFSRNVLFKNIFEFNVVDFVEENVSNPRDPDVILTELTDLLFPESASQSRKNYFIETFLFDGGSLIDYDHQYPFHYWYDLWDSYKSSSPSNRTVRDVNNILKSLVEALLWSQEYQTT